MTDFYEDDEVFRDINSFYKRLMERMFREMQDFEKAVKGGHLKGDWAIKPINEPGVRGYVAKGQFQLDGKPASFPRRVLEEKLEPLTDVFEDEEAVKIYIELPGVDKSDIHLDMTDGFAEIKAKNLFKRVKLPTANIDFEKAAASYKNGVLKITIPKIQKTVGDEKKRTIKIE